MDVNGPDGLPGHDTARLDQIHANVVRRVKLMAADVAMSLRIANEAARPEQVAQTLAGQCARSDPGVIATMFAAAMVLLGQQHNRDNGTTDMLPLPDDGVSMDEVLFEDRARAFCHSLVELMFKHGLLITSVLDMTLFDPVAGVDVAQGLHFNDKLTRYQCAAVPPQNWTVE